jgi:hypothetical protein
MRSSIVLGIVGLGLAATLCGCDLSSTTDLSEVSKDIIAARSATADATMSQLQTRDQIQLKDGSCLTAKQVQAGGGQGDVLRLRDQSCQ